MSLHWLSKLPCVLSDYLALAPVEEVAQVEKRNEEDWIQFFKHRAIELVPSGRFVGTVCSKGWPVVGLQMAIYKEFRDTGIISKAEFEGMVWPCFPPSKEIVEKRFAPGGPLSNCGLVLDSLEEYRSEDSFTAQLRAGILTPQTCAFFFIRIFAASTLLAGSERQLLPPYLRCQSPCSARFSALTAPRQKSVRSSMKSSGA